MANFKKPTPAEVTAYAKSIGFDLAGEEFCDYYASKGWMVGRAPMKDWQAAVRIWKRRRAEFSMPGGPCAPRAGASADLRRTQERIRERQLAEYRQELLDLRTWRKFENCPFDPVEAETRLWRKIRDCQGPAFCAELKLRLGDI